MIFASQNIRICLVTFAKMLQCMITRAHAYLNSGWRSFE